MGVQRRAPVMEVPQRNSKAVNMNNIAKALIFTTRRSYASAVLGVVILSVRSSVRLSVRPSVTRVLCD